VGNASWLVKDESHLRLRKLERPLFIPKINPLHYLFPHPLFHYSINFKNSQHFTIDNEMSPFLNNKKGNLLKCDKI